MVSTTSSSVHISNGTLYEDYNHTMQTLVNNTNVSHANSENDYNSVRNETDSAFVLDSNSGAYFVLHLTTPSVLQCFLYTLGILGFLDNTLAIYVISKSALMRKYLTNKLLLNQSVIDLLTSLFLILCNVPVRFEKSEKLNHVILPIHHLILCKMVASEYVLWCFLYTSAYNIVLIATERYMRARHFLHHRAIANKKYVAYLAVIIVWLFGPIIPIYIPMTTRIGPDGNCYRLTDWTQGNRLLVSFTMNFIFMFAAPITIVIYMYLKIVQAIHNRNRVAHGNYTNDNRIYNVDFVSADGSHPKSETGSTYLSDNPHRKLTRLFQQNTKKGSSLKMRRGKGVLGGTSRLKARERKCKTSSQTDIFEEYSTETELNTLRNRTAHTMCYQHFQTSSTYSSQNSEVVIYHISNSSDDNQTSVSGVTGGPTSTYLQESSILSNTSAKSTSRRRVRFANLSSTTSSSSSSSANHSQAYKMRLYKKGGKRKADNIYRKKGGKAKNAAEDICVKKGGKNVADDITHNAPAGSGTILHRRNQRRAGKQRQESNLLKTLIIVNMAFFLCHISDVLRSVINMLGLNVGSSVGDPIYDFTVFLVFVNCALNPFIYALNYNVFKQEMMRYVVVPCRSYLCD